MAHWHLALLLSVLIPSVCADDWDDFAGNLAADLVCLSTLFCVL